VGLQLWRFWHHAWGFDALYDRVFVRPYLMLTALHRRDWINSTVNIAPQIALLLNGLLVTTQNGRLRWYALSIFAGAAALLAALLFG
jgi:NADH-quinone oxidoreductase subunit L